MIPVITMGGCHFHNLGQKVNRRVRKYIAMWVQIIEESQKESQDVNRMVKQNNRLKMSRSVKKDRQKVNYEG